jgi:hypothetical protein
MEQKRIPVQSQDFDKVSHFEASITHWSREHTRMAAGAMDALNTVRDLHIAKNKFVETLCKDAGIDTTKVARLNIGKDGDNFVMDILVQDEAEKPVEAAPAS